MKTFRYQCFILGGCRVVYIDLYLSAHSNTQFVTTNMNYFYSAFIVAVLHYTIHALQSALITWFSAVSEHVVWICSALSISCPCCTIVVPVLTANIFISFWNTGTNFNVCTLWSTTVYKTICHSTVSIWFLKNDVNTRCYEVWFIRCKDDIFHI